MQTKFQQALEVLTDHFLSDLPPIIEDFEFSEKFKRRIERLIRRWEKPYYILINTAAKRAACIIACIIIAISALTISVRAFLPDVWNIIIEWFDEYISVGFQTETDATPETIEEIMVPKYVPEGFETSGTLEDPWSYEVTYLHDGVLACTISQRIYEIPLFLDDDSLIQNIPIYKYNGIISMSDDFRFLTWNDGKYYFNITVYEPSLSDDELIAIAESMYE